MFELRNEKKLDGSWDLSLVILQALDRETVDHYDVIIIARDAGDPPRSGNVTIKIEVTDQNDNSPNFGENVYEVDVPEHVSIMSRPPNFGEIVYEVDVPENVSLLSKTTKCWGKCLRGRCP